MLPHGRPELQCHPLKLPDQASARGGAPISNGVAVRHRSLDPLNTNLGNFITSLGKYRQVRQSWVSSSLSGPGGDPAYNLGFLPPLLEHVALGEGKAEKLELEDAIHIVDVHMRACKDKLSNRKGIKQEDPKGELDKSLPNNNKSNNKNNTEERQLDQARLLEGQLRADLVRKKLQLRKLQQEEANKNSNNNNLGTSSLSNISNNDLGANNREEQTLGNNSLGREDQQNTASRSEWQILIDTGAEISVAPRSFAAEVQLSTLGRPNLQLRNAEGKAFDIFGWKTVRLITQSFSFCITFAIADVEAPLLGLGSLLASDLNLHIGKN